MKDLMFQLETLGKLVSFGQTIPAAGPYMLEALNRIKRLEQGYHDILNYEKLPFPIEMIAKACLADAIEEDGTYCFAPELARLIAEGEQND